MKDEASIWLESRKFDKSEFVAPEPQEPIHDEEIIDEIISEEDKLITDKERRSELNLIALSQPTADIITSVIDSLIPVLFVLIIKGAEQDKLKLTPEEHSTVSAAFANYLKDSNVQLSPGLVLIFTILTVYGSKITAVMISRKEQKKQIELLQEQNRMLKTYLESQDIDFEKKPDDPGTESKKKININEK